VLELLQLAAQLDRSIDDNLKLTDGSASAVRQFELLSRPVE